jgi:hypothetical protein
MPIQIMELNIKVSVSQPGTSGNAKPETPAAGQDPKEDMVDECVEQIVKIIADKKER